MAKVSEDPTSDLREIGCMAVWSLSSVKPGSGLEQLRDDSPDSFWQSDGPQPHYVNIQFQKKMSIKQVSINLDFKQDDSYTPQKISIRAGTYYHDLQEISNVHLDEPNGWIHIQLYEDGSPPLRAFLLQVAVISNHQNGKDTHIRQLKVFASRNVNILENGMPPFTSRIFQMHSTLR